MVWDVVCLRQNDNYNWHPVQFASRSLNISEQHYSILEREALSVIFAMDKFRKFLLGTKFVIHNDQKPLRTLFTHNAGVPSSGSSRLQRWYLKS